MSKTYLSKLITLRKVYCRASSRNIRFERRYVDAIFSLFRNSWHSLNIGGVVEAISDDDLNRMLDI